MKEVFRTNKYIFRTFNIENFDDFVQLNEDESISKYVNHNANGAAKTFRECIEKFQEIVDMQEKYGFSYWGVYKPNGTFIGQSGLAQNYDGTFNFCYMFKKEYWGKGIGTEVNGLVIDYLFTHFPIINSIKAMSFIDNIASVKLLKKLGFMYINSIEEFGKELQLFKLTRENYENNKKII